MRRPHRSPLAAALTLCANRSLISEAATRATFPRRRGIRHPFELRDTSILLGEKGLELAELAAPLEASHARR